MLKSSMMTTYQNKNEYSYGAGFDSEGKYIIPEKDTIYTGEKCSVSANSAIVRLQILAVWFNTHRK